MLKRSPFRLLNLLIISICLILALVFTWLTDKQQKLQALQQEFLQAVEVSKWKLELVVASMTYDDSFLKMKSWGLDYAIKQKLLANTRAGLVDRLILIDKNCNVWASSKENSKLKKQTCVSPTTELSSIWSVSDEKRYTYSIAKPMQQKNGTEIFIVGELVIGEDWLFEFPRLRELFSRYDVKFLHKLDTELEKSLELNILKDNTIFVLAISSWWSRLYPQFLLDSKINYWLIICFLLILAVCCAVLDSFSLAKLKSKSENVIDTLLIGNLFNLRKKLSQQALENSDIIFMNDEWKKFTFKLAQIFNEEFDNYNRIKLDYEHLLAKYESLNYEFNSLREKQQIGQKWHALADTVAINGTKLLQTIIGQVERLQCLQEDLKANLLHDSQFLHQISMEWQQLINKLGPKRFLRMLIDSRENETNATQLESQVAVFLRTVSKIIDQIINISVSIDFLVKDHASLTPVLSHWCSLALVQNNICDDNPVNFLEGVEQAIQILRHEHKEGNLKIVKGGVSKIEIPHLPASIWVAGMYQLMQAFYCGLGNQKYSTVEINSISKGNEVLLFISFQNFNSYKSESEKEKIIFHYERAAALFDPYDIRCESVPASKEGQLSFVISWMRNQ